jgi:5-methylthioadenosine/S-adenosylhomocysteine deaminase
MPIARRSLLRGLAASAALPSVIAAAAAQTVTAPYPATAASSRHTLIKGGTVASLDPAIGELAGDVLIADGKIAAVAPSIDAADAEVIDARRKLVMPGLIDTHRHTWETLTRSWISEGDLAVYMKVINGTLGPRYRPEDVYIGNLLGAIGALNAGITTLLDWSHIMNSPAHADAAVQGLADSGMRAVFAYGYSAVPGWEKAEGAEAARAADIKRVQQRWFRSDDQLLSLAMAARFSPEAIIADIKLARSLGVRTTIHAINAGLVAALDKAGVMGPDLTYVHTIGIEATDDEYRMIAASGGTISSSSATEMMSGHGFPSAQRWLKFGLRPSFSVDNETRMPSDLFAQMRALVLSDHMLETERVRKEGGRPVLIPVRDVLEFATVEGAKATGLSAKTGSLTPGKRADVVLVDLDDVALIPAIDPVATVVLRAHAGNVSWVFVDGVAKKREGKLVGVDWDRLHGLVDASNGYITGLIRAAGMDISRG